MDRKIETSSSTVLDREELVKQNLWLVKCIAKTIAESVPANVDVDDLVSAGTVGLIKAIDEFDPSRGTKIETYARHRIRGAILDELRKHDVFSYPMRQKLKQIENAITQIEAELKRYPTDSEIAERTGLDIEEINNLLALASSLDLYSLDEIVENGGIAVDMQDEASRRIDPLSEIERKEILRLLEEAIRELPESERVVLSLYYYEGLRMKEIGEVLGISESRVSQIHSRAILLLRGRIRRFLEK